VKLRKRGRIRESVEKGEKKRDVVMDFKVKVRKRGRIRESVEKGEKKKEMGRRDAWK
jgi:hypothetical protein